MFYSKHAFVNAEYLPLKVAVLCKSVQGTGGHPSPTEGTDADCPSSSEDYED